MVNSVKEREMGEEKVYQLLRMTIYSCNRDIKCSCTWTVCIKKSRHTVKIKGRLDDTVFLQNIRATVRQRSQARFQRPRFSGSDHLHVHAHVSG